ncbi:MAG: efflux RND transporter periplasmic adaptor subunit [Methylocella sp.]
MKHEEKVSEINAPATPGRVSGMPRRAQFTILFIIAAVVVGVWLIGPAKFRAMISKKDTSVEKVAPSGAAGFKLTPQQWASIRTATVKEMTFQPERQAEGKIAIAEDRTTSVFPPYSGRVTAVFVDEGARVEQGQALFRLDSTDLVQAQNDVVAGTAAVAKAQSQVTLTQTTEQRAHQLFLAKGGALKDWQQAQADLAAAQNDQKSAQIALAAAKDRLRIILGQSGETAAPASVPARTSPDLAVPAPISGTVLLRKLGIGQYLSQGATDPVMMIGDLSTVWLTANVRETDAPFVRAGQPVEVRVIAYPDRIFKAKITFVAAIIDPNSHKLPIRAEVTNEEGLLKPEMWADFSIATGASRKGLAVPAQAIVYEGETARVWVAGKDRYLTSHEIKVGITDGKNVEALSGVSAGEQVVTEGSIFVDRAAGND